MKRKYLIFISAILTLIIGMMVICDCVVEYAVRDSLYDNADSIPHRKVGLVLGTSPNSTWNGRRNYYFDHRIRAAADLYKAGKVDMLVVSGGDYRKTENGYDEPVAMHDSLIKQGVDSLHIILDYDGTRTLNSIAKMRDVYRQDSIIIISQEYHNERALYQAKHLGIDIGLASQVNSDKIDYSDSAKINHTELTKTGRQTVGLVLSGGDAKGVAHVGVIKALEENGIPVDYVAGTSMGAIVGSLFVEHLQIKKFTMYVHPYVEAYIKKGMFSLYGKWRRRFGRSFKILADESLAYLQYRVFDEIKKEIDLKEESDFNSNQSKSHARQKNSGDNEEKD